MIILSVDAAKVLGRLGTGNLPTDLPAGTLTGTLPDAVFPATLPAASGTNLTSLPAGHLVGSLPAISGAALTGVTAVSLVATGDSNLNNHVLYLSDDTNYALARVGSDTYLVNPFTTWIGSNFYLDSGSEKFINASAAHTALFSPGGLNLFRSTNATPAHGDVIAWENYINIDGVNKLVSLDAGLAMLGNKIAMSADAGNYLVALGDGMHLNGHDAATVGVNFHYDFNANAYVYDGTGHTTSWVTHVSGIYMFVSTDASPTAGATLNTAQAFHIANTGEIVAGTGQIQVTNATGHLLAPTLTGNMPAIDGSALTNLTSSHLVGALPAISGAALTSLTSGNLVGALPAISGAALTVLTSGSLVGALPALDGGALTNLTAANLAGIVPRTNLPGAIPYTDGDVTFAHNVVVTGDFTVNGTQTIVNSETVHYQDALLALSVPSAFGTDDPVPPAPSGFQVYRGNVASVDRPYAQFAWDEGLGAFKAATSNAAGVQLGMASFQGQDITAIGQFVGSGAGLTAVPGGVLSGALAAVDGSALVGLTFSQLGGSIAAGQQNIASGSDLGAIRIGSGLSIDGDGIVTVDGSGTVTSIQFGSEVAQTGAVVVGTSQIEDALGYTPVNAAGDNLVGALAFTVGSTSDDLLSVKVTGDAFARWHVQGNGLIGWGPGTAGADTNLYRNGIGALATNGSFTAASLAGDGSAITGLNFSQLAGTAATGQMTKATSGATGAVKPGDGMAVDGAGALTNNNRPIADTIMALGDISTALSTQDLGYSYVNMARVLKKIVVMIGTTAAAMSADSTIDVLMSTGPGNPFVTLFTTAAMPVVVANGAYNYVVLSGGTLPDITSIPDGAVITARVVSAPAGTNDLSVALYE